ncbi:MAG: hypothetical protein JJT82_06175 [Legionellaceae bacterium]|nr:hypothetical protein [Legionellaceae bacterium]
MIGMVLFGLLLFSTPIHAEKNLREVGIAVYVDDVTSIKPSEELFILEITQHLRWQSGHRSATDQYYYGPQVDAVLSEIKAPYYQILHLRGAIDSKYKALRIQADGMADYQESMGVQIETEMDMHRFPFDTQKLELLIMPYGSSPYHDHLYLLSDKVGINKNAHLAEWKINRIHSHILSQQPPMYQLLIHYQRLPTFYIYKIFIPMLLIMGISYAVLWMPNQPAINRLAVVITTMLTIVAFQWAASEQIPAVSYITAFHMLLLFFYLLIAGEAILITLSERLTKRDAYRLMYGACWLYPIIIVVGIAMIGVIWL